MNLPSFQITIWNRPHRAYGRLIEIDSDEVIDGLPGGSVQSFNDTRSSQRWPELEAQFPHTQFSVSPETLRSLAELANRIAYSFAEHPFTPMLGGSFFGLRISRGYQEATVIWQGRFEDQDEPIRNLYAAVEAAASTPST